MNGIPAEDTKQRRLLDLTLQNKELRHGGSDRLAYRIKHRSNWIVQADPDTMRSGQPQNGHSIQQAGVSQVGQEHVVVAGFNELAGFDKRRQIFCAGETHALCVRMAPQMTHCRDWTTLLVDRLLQPVDPLFGQGIDQSTSTGNVEPGVAIHEDVDVGSHRVSHCTNALDTLLDKGGLIHAARTPSHTVEWGNFDCTVAMGRCDGSSLGRETLRAAISDAAIDVGVGGNV